MDDFNSLMSFSLTLVGNAILKVAVDIVDKAMKNHFFYLFIYLFIHNDFNFSFGSENIFVG